MTNSNQPTITPEVGKRYVTRGGWITPSLQLHADDHYPFITPCGWTFASCGRVHDDETDHEFDLIAEYVEPSVIDSYRRDLEVKLYVQKLSVTRDWYDDQLQRTAEIAIRAATALIEAQEAQR